MSEYLELDCLELNTPNELYTELMRENLEDRILVINDNINRSAIENCIMYILKWNAEDLDLPIDRRIPITIYINSEGGDMFVASNLADVISYSQTPIKGVGFGMVASAGFHIFISCHTRIAFPNSVFLHHDGDIEVAGTNKKAKETMAFIDKFDERIKNFVLAKTDFTSEFYDENYNVEYYMFANEAKELGCVDKIVGIDCDLDYIL